MPTRRRFLTTTLGSSAVISLGELPPHFLLQAAEQHNESHAETILVVIQLSGGNDGLNTVVPWADHRYRQLRPTLAVKPSDVLRVNDDLGFHPAARGLADLLEGNKLCVVQGVGYSNPNRSHFESMDIWHTCRRKSDQRSDGWIGRCLEEVHGTSASDVPAMHLGSDKQPLALVSRSVQVPSIRSLDQFRLHDGGDRRLQSSISKLTEALRPEGSDLLSFVQSSTHTALSASRRFESAAGRYKTDVSWPETPLAEKLKTIAQLIDTGLRTRIYYVTLAGFDTHSQQADVHAALLRQFGDALSAFLRDIEQHGHGDRVVALAFSEFGRRVKENASEGTDHGAAAPMFVTGRPVQAGLSGQRPDLENLQDGDIPFDIDFRSVYGTVLDRWLNCDSEIVLGGRYPAISLFSPA